MAKPNKKDNTDVDMNILYVTNMYPSKDRIHDGIFIKEQIEYKEREYNIQYSVYLIDGIKSKFNYFKSIFTINKLVLQKKFDLVHVHYGLSGIFLLFNPFIKIPIIVTLHGSDIQAEGKPGLSQLLTKLAVRRSDQIIILNDNMANILKRSSHKLIKIPCGIDIEKFEKKRNNVHNKSFVIGFPATKYRLVKNYSLFKAIVDNLCSRGYKIDVIEFHGFTREEVAFHLSRLDCLLMTSFSEGSPQIIKEAMACGVPIISTNVGDVEILLEGIENCTVINSFNAEDFIEKIIELIKMEPGKRTTNGRDRLKQLELDQHTVCSKIFHLYESLVDNNYLLQTDCAQ